MPFSAVLLTRVRALRATTQARIKIRGGPVLAPKRGSAKSFMGRIVAAPRKGDSHAGLNQEFSARSGNADRRRDHRRRPGLAVRLGVPGLSPTALVSSIVGGGIFVMGLVIAGTLGDYKDAERAPTDLAAGLYAILRETETTHRV
ncbi:MAG TPA: hypothetical protein VJN19_12165 [Propionibacteriaceae bacterium]|nr:hypothetical protein [Propionibacteriaceae bacterium]